MISSQKNYTIAKVAKKVRLNYLAFFFLRG